MLVRLVFGEGSKLFAFGLRFSLKVMEAQCSDERVRILLANGKMKALRDLG